MSQLHRMVVVASSVLVAFSGAKAVAQPAPSTVERPRPLELRYDEDWSVLEQLTDDAFWDFLKRVNLGADELWFSAGGQIRLRGEGWSDDGFGAGEPDDAILGLARFRLHGDLHLTDWVRVFVEGKSSLATERKLPGGRLPLDVDKLDLQNVFVDLRTALGTAAALTARVGRQELSLGRGRLVGARDWANSRRTFDAARLIAEWERVRGQVFYARPVVLKPDGANRMADDVSLSGVYLSGPAPAGSTLDAYWLWVQRDDGRWGGVSGEETRHTTGLRFSTPLPTAFTLELEAGLQWGRVDGTTEKADVFAGFVSTQVAYTSPGPMRPGGVVGLDWASGDDAEDDAISTFDGLFGDDHPFYGLTDKVGRRNAVDVWGGLSFEPRDGLRFGGEAHVLQLEGASDALVDGDGLASARTLPSGPRRIGTELSLTASYVLSDSTRFDGGYAWLLPGELARQQFGTATTHFGFVQYAYTF